MVVTKRRKTVVGQVTNGRKASSLSYHYHDKGAGENRSTNLPNVSNRCGKEGVQQASLEAILYIHLYLAIGTSFLESK